MNGHLNLLNSCQMATFAAQGFLRFDEWIDPELSQQVFDELERKDHRQWESHGQKLDDVWESSHPLHLLFNDPKVRGMIESLVGPSPRYDHHFPHKTKPGSLSQPLHQDATYDTRTESFDIQISFFPKDTTYEMGGTRFLPGSHFRQIHESMIGRYQHIQGMEQTVCKAGTIVVWHHNLWHGAQPNQSDQTRYMFKLRLNPMVKQVRLWDTDDLDDPQIIETLSERLSWYGVDHRVETIHRIKFWRYLTGQSDFDMQYFMTRLENDPQQGYC